MKLNKVLGAYLQDLGSQIAESDKKICPQLMGELITLLSKLEEGADSKKPESSLMDNIVKDIKDKRSDKEMSPEECLMCELANMLGIGDLTQPGEFSMAHKPTVKIKIKKVSSSDDLNKILKELKEGGTVDLNTMNDRLGEVFDLNSLQEIMETPMFKKGGSINGAPAGTGAARTQQELNNTIARLKEQYKNDPELQNLTEDQWAGRGDGKGHVATFQYRGKTCIMTGDGPKEYKKEGGIIDEGITLNDFLSD